METDGTQKGEAGNAKRNPKSPNCGANRPVRENGQSRIPRARQPVLEGYGGQGRAGPEPATAARATTALGGLDALVAELVEQVADRLESRLANTLAEASEQPKPRLHDRRALATALGVCPDTVDRLRREGLPELTVGDVPRFDLALLPKTFPWVKFRAMGRYGPRFG